MAYALFDNLCLTMITRVYKMASTLKSNKGLEMIRSDISKEVFLAIAENLGFDPKDPHMDDLYPQVCNLMKAAAPIYDLDLTGVEPQTIFSPPEA